MTNFISLSIFEKSCLMTIEDFLEGVRRGGLMDDDGHGFFSTDSHMSDQSALPSLAEVDCIKAKKMGLTHVVWFNA